MALEDKKSAFSKGSSASSGPSKAPSSLLSSRGGLSRQGGQSKKSLLSFNNAGTMSLGGGLPSLTSFFQSPFSTTPGASGGATAAVVNGSGFEVNPVVPFPPTYIYYQGDEGSNGYFQSGYYKTS